MSIQRRKTIDVRAFVEATNRFLAAPGTTREQRQGVAIAIEHALTMAQAYGGYSYLPSEYLSAEEQTFDNVLRPDMDDSRRVYSTERIPR